MSGTQTLGTAVPWPIGESVPRRDGPAKVTGAAEFTSDLSLPGMAHARILRSPYPHARIRSIDCTAADALPGVLAVVTADRLSDVELRYGHVVRDHPLIADGVVRFVGEPVVAIVAEDAWTAEEALGLVDVEYEPLPWVTDPFDAMSDGAPVLHAETLERAAFADTREDDDRSHPNVAAHTTHAWGDVGAAFEQAAMVVEGRYAYPMAYAYAMEPYVAIARWSEGALTVWSSAQHPFMVRADLARSFSLPLSSVRVVVPYVGGGYGSKSYTKIEPLTSALALRAGRPVKLALSVEESIVTTRSVPATIDLSTAFDADGLILGRRARIVMNAGAYAENAPRVASKASRRLGGPYRIPALEVQAIAVYTNCAPGSSYRGLGGPQAVWAGESQMDEAARRLGVEPDELRARNLLERGERPWPGVRAFDADLKADLRIVADELRSHPARPGHGRAISVSASDGGAEPLSVAIMRLHSDGSVTLLCGSAEMGQGSSTVLAQIAAAELGVPLDSVQLLQSDTAVDPYDRSTGASRTTTTMGLAIQRAADDIRRQLTEWAGEAIPRKGEPLPQREGVELDGRLVSWSEIVRAWYGGSAGDVVGRGYVRQAGTTAELPLFWEVGCVGAEVSVDEETGEIRVERLVTLGDIGRAVHPRMAEGQDIGGAVMGMGVALWEQLVYEEGQLVNGNLWEYRVPRSTDLPDVRSFLAERADGVGPYGAKGGGEAAVNPIGPALAGALEDAVGVRIREAPLHPERVWRALRDRQAVRDSAQ